MQQKHEEAKVQSGLRGVVAAETELCYINGDQGILLFRGHPAAELATTRSYEGVAHLLWTGEPGEDEASAHERMAAGRRLPPHTQAIIDELPADIDVMSALRTGVSSLAGGSFQVPPNRQQARRIAACMPTIIARIWRRRQGREPVPPRSDLGHAANYLYMLRGEEPPQADTAALDAYMGLTAEHGMNASTFAARVTISTRSDLLSSVAAAVGTMKGPLHGGAPSEVAAMLDEIGTRNRAEPYLRDVLEQGERIMGFGHRVYRTRDPRAQALAEVAERFADDAERLALALHVEETAVRLLAEHKPGRQLHANVEFYAAAVLEAVNIPPALYTATFSAARTAGWTAHALEQSRESSIIRPRARYVGPREAADSDT